jgi:hypothetical protein
MTRMLLAFLALFLMPCVTVSAQQLPIITAKDLNKKTVNWPKDFTAERTILIVAFTRGQQPQIDAWVNALNLKRPGAAPWFETPLIKNPGAFVRSFIDNGMRSGIPGAAPWFETPLIKNPGAFVRSFIDNGMRSGIPGKDARSHVVTIYTDKKAFMKAMNLPDENIHVVVVSRTGKVIGQVIGTHTPEKEKIIEAALKP